MTIVDTSVWIDYLNGAKSPSAEWLDRNAGVVQLALFDLNVCEVLQGLRDERQFREARKALLAFPVLETGGTALALASAGNYRVLRQRGLTIRKTIDCLIASACILGGHRLLHNDRDFDPFELYLDLKVVRP